MALSKQLQRIHEAIMTIKQYGGVFGRNPTFNDVTIEGQLTFDGDIDINSDLKVSGDIETTGNVIIATSGKGIDFSATAGTGTSELLDDYEEGVWTPGIEVQGTPGTYTATASGIYRKVGGLVVCHGNLTNITEVVAGAASYFEITGLPFADIAGYLSVGTINLVNWDVPAGYNAFVGYDSTGARDYLIFGLNVDNATNSYLGPANLVSGTSDIAFTISYFV
jgi:hypothetical protein